MKNAYKFSQPIVLGPASSDPSGAANGAVYYNTAEQKFKVYENGAWKAIVTGSVDLTGYLKADGSVPLTANWSVGEFKLTNLAAPTDDNDAARKIYVDSAISSAIGAIDYPVDSVNGQTGAVVLGAAHIGYVNTTSGLVATTVQAAIDEVEGRLDTAESAISGHITDATDAHAASAITNTPSGNLAATDVQSALNELQSDVDSRIPSSEKGVALGVATLDVGGKVPASQLPSTLMEYLGVWNASTNSPALADGVGDTGNVYRVSVAGTQNLGSGAISFEVGDYVIYNGTVWEKSDTTDAVASVNGKQGVVTLVTDDIAEDGSPVNLWFTDSRAKTAAVVNSLAGSQTDQAPSVSAVNTELANYLKKDGTVAMTGNLNLDANNITNVLDVNAGSVTTDSVNTALYLNVASLIEESAFQQTCAIGTTTVTGAATPMSVYEGFEIDYTLRNTTSGEKRLGTIRAVYSSASGVSFTDTYIETAVLSASVDVTFSTGSIRLSVTASGSSMIMNGSIKRFKIPA